MRIDYLEEESCIYLHTVVSTYVIKIHPTGYVGHLYWGRRLKNCREEAMEIRPQEVEKEKGFSLNLYSLEYPSYGQGDLRHPAFQVEREDGTRITDLKYQSHRVLRGKPSLRGLPSTRSLENESLTLELLLRDEVIGLEVLLFYTLFPSADAIARSAKLINRGDEDLKIHIIHSLSVDFHRSDLSMLHLSGAWGRERYPIQRPLYPGSQSIESLSGMSSHHHNPFLALLEREATEERGEVYGFQLLYSGNFQGEVFVDHYDRARVMMGINPFDFQWLLERGESFQTPEGVLLYSCHGLQGLSQGFHALYRNHLLPKSRKESGRPILFNTWEAVYFDYNADYLLQLAKQAKDLGIELFLLDDGWFGEREDDSSSLGDWWANEEKLPGGLAYLGEKIVELGLGFGIWIEPEMVSPKSKLYLEKPHFALQVKDRSLSLGRNQLVLDLSQEEVQTFIINTLTRLLESAPISYVKWDMNRPLTEVGSLSLPPARQKEVLHRYVLGLYHILEVVTSRFPAVSFENCASGGGRFDPGLLYYMPYTWASDNTDAVERLKIQYATSIAYPLETMGAHVTSSPNHQMLRRTDLSMRGGVASMGSLGYELDLLALTEEERREIKGQIKDHKEMRRLLHQGSLYRLKSPFLGQEGAWMVVSEDKREALLGWYQILAKTNHLPSSLCLRGLDMGLDYKLRGGEIYSGASLMAQGFPVPNPLGDFVGKIFFFQAIP